MKASALSAFLVLLIISIPGFSQEQLIIRPGQAPMPRTPSQALASRLPQPGLASPQAGGPYRIVSRTTDFDRQTQAWKADSSWNYQVYDLLTVGGASVPKLTHTKDHSYQYPSDTSSMRLRTDGGATNRDTLQETFTYHNGAWRATTRNRWRYATDKVLETVEYAMATPQLTPFSQSRRRTVRDGLGRAIVHIDSQYNYINQRWSVDLDSVWYYGSTHDKARTRTYNISFQAKYLMQQQDSIQTGADGEVAYMVWSWYRMDGTESSRQRIRHERRGDSVIVSTAQVTDYFGTPQYSGTTETTVDYGDSMFVFADVLETNGLRYSTRARYRFHLPAPYPRLWAYDMHQERQFGVPGWQTTNRAKSRVEFSAPGQPKRIVSYVLDYNNIDSVVPSRKIDFEHYSPELITNVKPPRAQPKRTNLSLFTLAPNPVKHILTLFGHERINQVQFVNTAGQWYEMKVVNNKVDISALPPGIYQVLAFSGDHSLGTCRVIKE